MQTVGQHQPRNLEFLNIKNMTMKTFKTLCLSFLALLCMSIAEMPRDETALYKVPLSNISPSCSMSFTYEQVTCNTGSNDCVEVEFNVQGLYAFECGNNITSLTWSYDPGTVLCDSGNPFNPWSPVAPTYNVYIDIIATAINKGVTGSVPVGVTMNYSYSCSTGTCYGSYYQIISLIVC